MAALRVQAGKRRRPVCVCQTVLNPVNMIGSTAPGDEMEFAGWPEDMDGWEPKRVQIWVNQEPRTSFTTAWSGNVIIIDQLSPALTAGQEVFAAVTFIGSGYGPFVGYTIVANP